MSTDEKIIKNTVGLLKLAEMLGSVSETGKRSEARADQHSSGNLESLEQEPLRETIPMPTTNICGEDEHERFLVRRCSSGRR